MKKKKVAIAASVIATSLLACSIGAITAFAARPDGWTLPELESAYAYGSLFTVPDATCRVNGKDVAVTHSLVKPNDASVEVDEVRLDATGLYTLNYYATAGGVTYSESKNFYVDYPSVQHGSTSSVKWGMDKYADSNDPEVVYPNWKGHNTEGLLLRIGKNDTIIFNEMIDISDLTVDDMLLDGFITPDIRGSNDFTEIIFTFTDSTDPSVYLKIAFKHYEDYGSSYAHACGNGQIMSGWNYYDNKGQGMMHQGDGFGTSAGCSFTAYRFNSSYGGKTPQATDVVDAATFGNMFQLHFDKQDLSVYTRNPAANGNRIVKLNDARYFSKIWSGFKSNRVILSVSADGYVAETANICISKIHGVSTEKLRNMVTSTCRDVTAPAVTVYTDESALPNAVAGKTYPVFTATALDDYDGECPVSVKAWYNYNSENKTRVNIVDGRFATSRPGSYALEYVAEDTFGNRGVKVVNVNCAPSADPISFTVSGVPSTVKAGEPLTLPQVTSITGGTGSESDMTVTVVAKKGETEIPVTGYFFRPEEQGEWQIVYTVTDFVGEAKSQAYDMTVGENNDPVALNSPDIMHYYISGATYVVPTVTTRNYATHTDGVCTMRLTDKNGVHDYAAGATFVPEGDASHKKATLEFISGTNTLITEEVDLVEVYEEENKQIGSLQITVNSLKQEKFFHANGLTFEPSSTAMRARHTSASASWEFITPQMARNLSVVLSSFNNFNNNSFICLTLTDARDPYVSTYVKITKISSTSIRITTDAEVFDLPVTVNNSTELTLEYGDGMFYLNNTEVSIGNFAGFPSNRAYVSVSTSASVGSTYVIRKINDYVFTNSASDQTGPTIQLFGHYGGAYSIHDVYTFHGADCADVLFPTIRTFTLSVKAPNGSYAKDTDGVELNGVDPTAVRKLSLDAYGTYGVEIIGIDEKQNKTSFAFLITVVDEVAPTVAFKTELPEKVYLDTKWTLPEVEYSDNVDSAEDFTIIRYVINANGKRVWINDNEDGIVCKYTGEYEYHVLVIDKSGNIGEAKCSVTVQAKEGKK